MSSNLRLRTAVGTLLGSALASRAIGAVASVVTARALGPAGRGELALLMVIGMVAGVALTMGIDLWAARSGALELSRSAMRSILRTHRAVATSLTIVSAAVVGLALRADPLEVAACAALAWATAASMIKLGLLQAQNHMRSYAAAGLAGSVMYAGVVIVLAAAGSTTIALFLTAAAGGVLVTAGWPRPHAAGGDAPGVAPPYREVLRFGLPGMAGGLLTHGLYRLDVALVAAWGSVADAGLYSVALAVAELLWVLPNSAAQAIVPRASAQDPTLDTAQVSRVLVAITAAGSVVIMLTGPAVVPLVFGTDFRAATAALPGLVAASVAIGVWKLFSFQLLATGDPQTRLRTGGVGLIVMIVADFWLVPRWGVVGASWGAFSAYASAALLCANRWRREAGCSWRQILLLERGDVAALGSLRR